MSQLHDLLRFYGQDGWAENTDGVMVPTIGLLDDGGKLARYYANPTTVTVNRPLLDSTILSTSSNIAEALRDLLLASVMPMGEAKIMKIGSAAISLQNSEFRLRFVNRC